ncbi:uncharacterized protein K452DRAFT_217710, partial [Aplosporella prunicola CBS 121167]
VLRASINRRVHVWIIWLAMAATVITGAVFFFVTLLQCMPISYFWTKAVGGSGKCLDAEIIMALTYLYGGTSALSNFTFGMLPILLVWNLNMERRLKIALVPILSMACIASSAVLVRMAYVKDFKDPDFLWATVDIAIWSDTEQGLEITAGSLATLRPLFRVAAARLGYSGSVPYPTSNRQGPKKPRQSTVWPTDNSGSDLNHSKDGMFTLLQTEVTEEDVELVRGKRLEIP